MAFDAAQHTTDPQTGFAIDRDTGHLVWIEQAPAPVVRHFDYPKWVVPHESQVITKKVDGYPDHVSTPGFSDYHVNRVNGEVTVYQYIRGADLLRRIAYGLSVEAWGNWWDHPEVERIIAELEVRGARVTVKR